MRHATRALIAWAGAAVVLLGGGGATAATTERTANEVGTATPIKHLVLLMQENHSYDNYFGTYPGADGIPPGTCVPVRPDRPTGRCVEPFHVGGTAITDLGHSRLVFEEQYRGGKMDGFVASSATVGSSLGRLTMGYYDDRDIPFYWNVADEYVLFDRFFTSAASGSIANHMFWIAGRPGITEGESLPSEGFTDIPTIFDRLEARGIPWKFYIENYDPSITFRNLGSGDRSSQVVWAPLLAFPRFLDTPQLHSRIVHLDEYYRDLERGTLPAVAFMVPAGSSEHPPGIPRTGERFIRSLVTALMRSSAWNSSAFMWVYDDWGGWYDHVKPPRVDQFGFGFRTPALLVSPYARRGHVEHTTLDFTSMLKFIQENWGVAPLAARDRAATSIAGAFDFTQPPRLAVFVSGERTAKQPEPARPHIVYLFYGMGALLAVALIVAARLGGTSIPGRVRRLVRERRGAAT